MPIVYDDPESDYPDEPDDAVDRVMTPPGWNPVKSDGKIIPFSMVEPSQPQSYDYQEPWKEAPKPLPDDNPKTAHGVAKPGIDCLPPIAIMQIGQVMRHGADKYGQMNWRKDRISFSTYYNAIMRHAFAMSDGEWIDPESGFPHAAHIAAGMSVMLDAYSLNMMNDDRPLPGKAAAFIDATKKKVNLS